MRVALVHDCLVHIGGAERVLRVLHQMYPDAPIYTVVSDRKTVQQHFPDTEVRASFVNRLPLAVKYFRAYAPLYPTAVESFDFSGIDVVISSSFAFAKGIITPPSTCHICYCHTPLRYLWFEAHRKEKGAGALLKHVALDPLRTWLRAWDRMSSDRVDCFIANSEQTAARVAKYYRRNATVIYPPVRVQLCAASTQGEFYLIVARLMAYKRVDIAVRAFNDLGIPLKVVGTGPELRRLQCLAKPNIEFLGALSEDALKECYATCRGFVFPGLEDFGIVMVEAQSYGKPVIALNAGGAAVIVKHRETGILFDEQTPEALIVAVRRAEDMQFSPDRIRKHAMQFDESNFAVQMSQFVERAYAEHQERYSEHFSAGSSTFSNDALLQATQVLQ